MKTYVIIVLYYFYKHYYMSEKNNEIEVIDFEEPTTSKENNDTWSEPTKKNINIFDEFDTSDSLSEEISKVNKKENKDVYYYLSVMWKIFQITFFIFIFIFIFLFVYIYIQKDETVASKSYLNPVCEIMIWDSDLLVNGNCSSISYLEKHYKKELDDLKNTQATKIIKILPMVYEYENFTNTREVSFLLDKTKNRLDVIDVLSRFNALKNDFTGIEKKKLQCVNFEINVEEKILFAKCSTFLWWYDRVIWFSWNKNDSKARGSSISLANSFLNYIQKNNEYFSLVDRQKNFKVQDIASDSGYTNKTDFNLKLKINF